MTLREMRKALQAKYAWPGGYPLFGIFRDGGCVCPTCAIKEWRNIYQESVYSRKFPLCCQYGGWALEAVGVNWEDSDLICDNCGKRIERAYAEEEAEQWVSD